ncbi:M48 family metalloprotease [Chitinibacteraceae bacterium HSL-7]
MKPSFLISALLLAFTTSAHALDLNDLGGLLNGGSSGASGKDVSGIIKAVGGLVENSYEAMRDITPAERTAIGNGLAAQILGAGKLVRNDQLQRYVNDVGRWVAAQSSQPNLDWRFGVIDSPNINSFAMPGGIILITRGLYQQLASEAELAGVLGHEIAHVIEDHHIAAIRSGRFKQASGNIAEGLLAYKGNAQGRELLANAAKGATEVFVRGLDKDDEFEADSVGMQLAAKAGYNPYALVSVLQRISLISPQDSSVALLFSTHPAPNARIDRIDQTVGDRLEPFAGNIDRTARFYTLP